MSKTDSSIFATISNFLQRHVYNSGLANAGNDSIKAEKIEFLNKLVSTLLFTYPVKLVYEIYLYSTLSALQIPMVGFALMLAMIVVLFVNRKGYYEVARNLSIVSVAIAIFAATYFEGTSGGRYLFFLPLISVFALLIKLNEKTSVIVGLFGLVLLTFILCLAISPRTSGIPAMNTDFYKFMYGFNLWGSVLTVCILTTYTSIINLEKERELRKAKVVAEGLVVAKSTFLSNLSHELRTPLNGIIGTSNLLLQEDFLYSQREYLNILKYSSEHMLLLINDILDYSKLEAEKIELEKKPVNFQVLLSKTEAQFSRQAKEKGLDFVLDHDQDIYSFVMADDTRFTQVLNNLLSNALKFTSRGRVTLSAKTTAVLSNSISIRFSVKDTGIGIPTDKQARIFESFTQADEKTTRKFGGTGLGLSISKKIVEAFGGNLLVESEQGVGSEFYFILSFLRSPFETKPEIENHETVFESLSGLKLLIAEDNTINMKVATSFLKKWEVTYTEAENGLIAVEHCRKQKFDLILLDLEMPEMDGYTALKEIRKMHPRVPAFAFTAAMFQDIDAHLQEKGFNDFIKKPFRPGDLYNKIKKYKIAPFD